MKPLDDEPICDNCEKPASTDPIMTLCPECYQKLVIDAAYNGELSDEGPHDFDIIH